MSQTLYQALAAALFSFLTLFATPIHASVDKTVSNSICPSGKQNQWRQELQVLLEQVNHYNDLYELGTPAISDDDYDALIARQQFIEQCLDTTTALPSASRDHRYPMGSLKKAKNAENIEDFLNLAARLGSPVILQPKIDGIAIELVYHHGRLVQALTRGSQSGPQRKGINLLPLIPNIPAIPKILPGNPQEQPREVILHGELYARNDNTFAKKASTPRHYTAGLINRTSPPAQELKQLTFFPWLWVNSPLTGIHANVQQMEHWGFKDPQQHTHSVKSLTDITHLRSHYQQQHNAGFMPLDGVVIKLEKSVIQSQLGHLDGTPYWALAWKFPATSAATPVSGITWSIGRTGQVTAILEVEPISLNGLTITQVNIGPISHFNRLDIARHDTVIIALKGRANPVLKQVVSRPDNRLPVMVPDQNRFNNFTCFQPWQGCHKQFMARLLWLTGRQGLNLPSLTVTKLEQLVDSNSIQQLEDLFTLTSSELPKETAAALDNQKLSLTQAIQALGIPEVGHKRSRLLADKAGHWWNIQTAPAGQIQKWLKCSMTEALTIKLFLERSEVEAVAQHLFKKVMKRIPEKEP